MLCFDLLCDIREQAAEDEEEDEGIASDQNPNSNTEDIAEVPKEENKEEKEEDDELAEYKLDKYDDEDIGEEILFTEYLFSLYCVLPLCLCLLKHS